MQTETPAATINGLEFYGFIKDCPGAALGCLQLPVHHAKYGVGTIQSVTPRSGMSPLFGVFFPGEKKFAKFNLDAFKSGMLPQVELPNGLLERVQLWRVEAERRAEEERIAEEVAAETLRQQRQALLAAAEASRAAAEAAARLRAEELRERETRVIPFQGYMVDIPQSASAVEQMDREHAARVSYNSNVIPNRVRWLGEWAGRIASGEPGLEPSWSRGQSAASYLQQKGVSHLWHFTDIRNLENIFRVQGLLSYEGVEALIAADGEVWLSSNEESIRRDMMLRRQDTVRLSFIPNSFFFQRVRFKASLVWLRFSLSALSLGEVCYSQGNAASFSSNICLHPQALAIDWSSLVDFGGDCESGNPPVIYPKSYSTPFDDPDYVYYKKSSINSEILIKHFLSLDFCTGVWDVDRREWLDLVRT